jgi:hypothetical protein
MGAQTQLVMFLSGPGGCGKCHVIGAAKTTCQHFCRAIHHQPFDSSAFIVTASTNLAAAQIGGATIHSVAKLRKKFANVSINGNGFKSHWLSSYLIIIDEISLLPLGDFEKLDKHFRKLMREVYD